jgi:hypothetical protein
MCRKRIYAANVLNGWKADVMERLVCNRLQRVRCCLQAPAVACSGAELRCCINLPRHASSALERVPCELLRPCTVCLGECFVPLFGGGGQCLLGCFCLTSCLTSVEMDVVQHARSPRFGNVLANGIYKQAFF